MISPNFHNPHPPERWTREELIAEVNYLRGRVRALLAADNQLSDAYADLEDQHRRLKAKARPPRRPRAA